MVRDNSSRRLLLVAGETARDTWRPMIPESWEVGTTANIEHARLIQRVRACDAVLLSSDIPDLIHADTAERLFASGSAPVVLVTERAEGVEEIVLSAVRAGMVWLPGDSARQRPELLRAVLEQAMRRSTAPRLESCAEDCHSRVDRLLEMLWQAVPGTIAGGWFSQRHMLERLDEEVARTQRDGGPLSVILGEIHSPGPDDAPQSARAREWAVQQISQHKRRCDVAGQYGLDGFMMVLPRATQEQARGACRRFQTVLAHPPEGLPPVHVSFGFAGVPGDRPNLPGLLGRAEQRLEDARHSNPCGQPTSA